MPKWLKLTKDWKAEKAGKIISIENDVQADTLIEAGVAEAAEDPTKDIVKEAGEQLQAQMKAFGTEVAEQAVAKYLKTAADLRTEGKGAKRPHIVVNDPYEFDDPRFGFKNFGEQLKAVHQHVIRGKTDEKLDLGEKAIRAKAPTNYTAEGVGADGGFSVAPDFNTEILSHTYSDEALLPRCRNLTTSGNTYTYIKDETVAWGTDGVQAYWTGETAGLTDSKIKLTEGNVTLSKLTVLVPVTNELLEDSAIALAQYIMSVAPQKIADKVNGAIIGGTGVGQPLGVLNSGAVITQNKDSGQAANTFTIGNATNMISRQPAYSQKSSIWLHHSTVLPQILQLTIGNYPVFVAPGGATNAPYGALWGRPLVPSEQCQALTNKGDIYLLDLKQYLAVTKSNGIRSDMSVHVYFDRDVSAFRFVFRIAGAPWMQAPITQKNGGGTLSPFVTLQAR